MKIFEELESWKKQRNEDQEITIEAQGKESAEQAKEIVKLLESLGAVDIYTNDYAFQFKVGNRYFSLYNQTSRIVGHSYRTDHDDTAKWASERWLMPDNLKRHFDNLAVFRHYCIEGPRLDVVRQIAKGHEGDKLMYREDMS